jgi:hypothetical protein
LDPADAGSFSDSELDIAIYSPVGAPGVLDQVEVGAVLCSVANCEDSVVNGMSTVWGGNDTSGVVMEHGFVSLNRDRDWSP